MMPLIVPQPNLNYQLVKQRLSVFSPLSAFHPDSISRRGSLVIIRHALSPVVNVAVEAYEWRTMLADKLPEAEVSKINVDPKRNLRAYLNFSNPIKACAGGCGGEEAQR